MARKTATEGVYITDSEWEFLRELRKVLLTLVFSETDNVTHRVEAFIGSLVVTALVHGVSKEVLLESVEKVYEWTKNHKPIYN